METNLTNFILFAQDQGQGSGLLDLLLPFLIIGVFFYFLLIRPQRQEQSRRRSMLAAVKKNDRVVTAGGIYGVVTNVDQSADEVTLKVDEANNTKLRMTLSSIVRVLQDGGASESASQ